uniref:Uncharacterized protein n=1 Tax=Panagrolaimus davidi TaxID=227884 RepID=A0A914P5N7_9BILA
MDNMNNLQLALPSFTASSEPSPQIYTFQRPYSQSFSLSCPMIRYMIIHCKSGKAWKKLIMSCKYFYSKKSVFPVGHLDVVCDLKCKADGEMFDSSLTFPKLWLYDLFSYESYINDDPTTIAPLIPKIFEFNLRVLQISHQTLTLNEYQNLTATRSLESLQLIKCAIKNADGITVTVDKLLEGLERLEHFDMCVINGSSFHCDTVEKMVKILNGFTKMRWWKFEGLTETFRFSDFAGFLMSNEVVIFATKFSGRML